MPTRNVHMKGSGKNFKVQDQVLEAKSTCLACKEVEVNSWEYYVAVEGKAVTLSPKDD